ncbi:MAG TPA: (2Fe-2S)-binding protein [Usitatibacter sp.]|jgi:nicotinate dehydrogenase subunit A|nr:(2Fe-2S)-binding protein [Usitatibacter sp.]
MSGRIEVNGTWRDVSSEADTPLLYVLRDELALNGAKYGCGLGQCGACTVLVDDEAVFSCVTPLAMVDGRRITTLEGLASAAGPGPIQQAFIEEQAAQCGFCIPGMIMRTAALLRKDAHPDEAAIRKALHPNLCRCGTHMRILRAAAKAAKA